MLSLFRFSKLYWNWLRACALIERACSIWKPALVLNLAISVKLKLFVHLFIKVDESALIIITRVGLVLSLIGIALTIICYVFLAWVHFLFSLIMLPISSGRFNVSFICFVTVLQVQEPIIGKVQLSYWACHDLFLDGAIYRSVRVGITCFNRPYVN